MPEENHQNNSFLPKIARQLKKTLSSTISAIAEAISSSVHISEFAIGPIIGSLITATTTLIIGLITISNIFSEQFLYRPLQIQESNANFNLSLDSYHHKVVTDYLNQMAQLMLEYPLGQLQQNPFLLRAITQETLQETDGERKRYVIMFLKDAQLLSSPSKTTPPLLESANLREAKLDHLKLGKANFQGADLSKANLEASNLQMSNLAQTNLNSANLSGADLRGANLQEADLSNATLVNACYNLLTQFAPQFDPTAAKMQLVQPFTPCKPPPLEQEKN